MKIDKRNPKHWLLLTQQALFTLLAIALRPFSKQLGKPMVVMYGHQLSGNLKALYEEWQRSFTQSFTVHFLSLDPNYSATLEQEGVNVLRCNRLKDMLALRKTAAMITDHGLHTMTPLVRFTNIKFIDVWHGIPFKGFVPDDFRLQHRYDEVWVSSPLLKELYRDKFGFPPDIVKSLGYARTDKLFLRTPPDTSFTQQSSIPEDHRVVLYAPTWQQDDSGRELFPFGKSQDAFIEQLSNVCKRNSATLVIRCHLNSSIGEVSLENVRYCSMKDFPDSEELLQNIDLLICDWSSIAFDYLALDRPTVFLEVEPPFKNGFSLGREYRFGKVATNMAELCDSLDKTLADPAWYASTHSSNHRRLMSEVYGNNTDGKSAARQWSRLVELFATRRA